MQASKTFFAPTYAKQRYSRAPLLVSATLAWSGASSVVADEVVADKLVAPGATKVANGGADSALMGVYDAPVALLFARGGRLIMETRNGNLQTFISAEKRWRSIYYLGSDLDFNRAGNYYSAHGDVREPDRFVRITGDGKTLFGASRWQRRADKARVYAWDIATRKTKFVVAVLGDNGTQNTVETTGIDVSRDGKILIFAGNQGLQLVDLTGPWKAAEHDSFHVTRVYSARALPFEGQISALALAPDSETLAIFTNVGLGLFDVTMGQQITRVQSLVEAAPLSLDTTRPTPGEAASPENFGAASGFGAASARGPILMKWSGDGQFLAAMRGDTLWLLSADGQLQARATTRVMPGRDSVPTQAYSDSDQGWPPLSLDWSPDNRAIATGGAVVEVWSAPDLNFIERLPALAPAAFLPDGSLVTPKPDDAPRHGLLTWQINKP